MRNFLLVVTMILLVGCASSQGPTRSVGIVNGKYTMRTVIPNNNKGKKVAIANGQDYHCVFTGNSTTDKYSFDLRSTKKMMILSNFKYNGKIAHSDKKVRKLAYNPKIGYKEINGKWIMMFSGKNDGKISISPSTKEYKQKRGFIYECTQTTNNDFVYTKTMTRDEIDFYKHNQQIALQQRAIDSADYNAAMANLQAQTAQTNYNTQQMMNRMNTYKVNVYHY